MAGRRETHRLQDVLFPGHGHPPGLYLSPLPDAADPQDAILALEAGTRVSTDTYFGAFYLGYWSEFTDIGRIGVEVSCTGELDLRIMHHHPDAGPAHLLHETRVESPGRLGTHVIWFDDPGHGLDCGRIFLELHARTGARVHAMTYVTDAAPANAVRLSIGICTFNRERYLDDLLGELAGALDRNPDITGVTVVNQGKVFETESVKLRFDDPRFRLIAQGNLGGCGGFNRTIYEAVHNPDAPTHHLLMDDDIEIDARVLDTATAFLRHARAPLVLGGHMLNATSPETLFEAGAVFDPFWFVRPLGKDTDLEEPANLDEFDRPSRPAYNGWWFCIMPVQAMRDAGHSPPVFIRCDDMEYGCRLGKMGVPTVSLPPVAVWHELNYSHGSDWDQYYDIRNRLILSALHGDLTAPPAASVVHGYIIECLLTHRYTAARMCMAGIADFLAGPDRLFRIGPAERHAEVTRLSTREPRRQVGKPEALAHEWGTVVDRPGSAGEALPHYVRRILSGLFLPYPQDEPRLFRYQHVNPLAVGSRSYILADARLTSFALYAPERGRFFRLLLRSVGLAVKYLLFHRRTARDWRRNVARYQTAQYWETLFGIVRPAVSGGNDGLCGDGGQSMSTHEG